MILRHTIIGLALLIGLTACNTMQGAGRDVQGAGQAIEGAAKDVQKKM